MQSVAARSAERALHVCLHTYIGALLYIHNGTHTLTYTSLPPLSFSLP